MSVPVSVIIPAYNCAACVGETVRSVLSQSFRDFELILVNDGSTDDTLSVLERLAQGDCRVKILSVPNGGPANARNAGIHEAQGVYLYFMDSDDLINSDMLQAMYTLAVEQNLDEVCCGYLMENVSAKTPHIKAFSHPSFVAETAEEFRAVLMPLIKAHLMYVVWNKLFKAAWLSENGISFENYLSGEDRLFNTRTFAKIGRFGMIDKPLYRYFLRGQQTLANRYVQNRFDSALLCHTALIDSYKEMGLYDESNRAYIDFVFVKAVMACFTQLNSKGCPLKFAQKRRYIADILQNELVKAAIRSSDEQVRYSKIVNGILRTGNTVFIYLLAKAIFTLQFKLNALYLNIKHQVKKESP